MTDPRSGRSEEATARSHPARSEEVTPPGHPERSERSAPGRIVRAAIILLVLAALIVFARSVEWAAVWRAVRSTSPGMLVAAALVNLASVLIKGVRWWIFLRPVGVRSLALAMRGTFVGAGLNNILIANGGEAARVVYVSREANAPATTVIATLAMERLFEIVGWAFTLTLAVTVLDLPASLDVARPFALLILGGMIALVVWLLRHPEQAELPAIEGSSLIHRARRFGRGFVQSLRAISSGPRFLAALGVSIAVWVLQIATYHLTAVAAGLPIPLVGTIAAMLAVNLGFAVRATPGNVGVFQMVYAVTAAGFGMDKDLATGTAFLIQIQQILPVTALGLAFAPTLLRKSR